MSENNNEVVLSVEADLVTEIETTSKKYELMSLGVYDGLKRTMFIAQGIRELKKIINEPAMELIMELKNSNLGFKTDEASRKKPYTIGEIRNCVIEALMRGLSIDNNEFNIISGNQYTTKNGFTSLLNKLKGFEDFQFDTGIPKMNHEVKQWTTHIKASWTMHGKAQHLETEIALQCHSSTSIDALVGKAECKLKYRVYCQAHPAGRRAAGSR